MNDIERYLHRLAVALRGSGADVPRVLAETREHLRDAIRDGVAEGLTEEEAGRRAVARFGSPRVVARRFGGGFAWREVVPELARVVVPSGAIGLVAIGVSGLLAEALGRLFGAAFVAGGMPARYTSRRCAVGNAGHDCLNALIHEHLHAIVGTRVVYGAFGLLVLAGYLAVRRRLGAVRLAPRPGVVPLAGTTLYGVAAAVLLIDGVSVVTYGGTRAGSGQSWSDGGIALVMFLVYARSLYRERLSRSTA
ncbi:hypothetical protein GCM10023191_051860 [Actinoallomurus oryzae]|uniref:DUF1700 domain-containing protein n=1 Tax=Actinoallomurus oryzae TaxID=502180 RepID=A0ABP8QDE4_9ACTN